MRALPVGHPDDLVAGLTPRRRAVLELASKGLTNAEIGTALGISPATVRTHMTAILAELEVTNRTEAAASFLRQSSAPERIATVLGRPALSVLPIETLDEREGTRVLARGLTADLASLFARWCWFPVIDATALLAADEADATHTPRAFDLANGGEADRRRSLAERLGARFLVVGTLRESRDGFRLVVRIDEASTGHCLWTDRFSFPANGLFAIEDAICEQIVATAYPVMLAHGGKLASGVGDPSTFDGWALAQRGMALQAHRERASNLRAWTCFEGALAAEPNLVLAHFGLGLAAYDTVLNQWDEEPDEALAVLARCTEACQTLAPHGAEGYFLEARLCQTHGHQGGGIPALERAIGQNPSFAPAHALLAQFLCLAGREDEGLVRMEHASRLSPQAFVAGLSVVHFIRGEYATALGYAETTIARKPSYTFGRIMGVASAFWLGDRTRAESLAAPLSDAPTGFAAQTFRRMFGPAVDGVARIEEALAALGARADRPRRAAPPALEAAAK